MHVGQTFTHGPKSNRRTFKVTEARRLSNSFDVRYVIQDTTTGETLLTYAKAGKPIPWNARLAHGQESFTKHPTPIEARDGYKVRVIDTDHRDNIVNAFDDHASHGSTVADIIEKKKLTNGDLIQRHPIRYDRGLRRIRSYYYEFS